MERQRTESAEWVEVLSLQPTAHECRAYCLEPGETLFITLAAARPVDAALIDWETYKCWRVDGGGASIESRFAKETYSITWQARSLKPPYILVLLVRNSCERPNCVRIEAKVNRTKAKARRKQQNRRREAGR